MIETPSERLARQIALAIPALLLAGAYIGQYGFGLYPCEMCLWQRWPHFAAVGLALVGSFAAPRTLWVGLAALAILASGGIGAFHAGVEYGWWEGITACANAVEQGGDPLDAIMNAPIVRCDMAPWDLFGISLAGWNFLISTLAGVAVLVLLARRSRA
ncbi:disulfide bond formation protein B [Parerythrobacter jejuensis]|uniref:Disulfide bond formation protein B n=1 Tax=Parerythrobacter jejuensis TaxID=795812 RepID=A0A845AVV7_9SPHN|nr:disulfide bond formation protein B [Parerythrobacter jejuensis]MXP30899.1 disulfide bond formation protein B [Parerythrobacter jejuensis]MXP33659.1 disulfide bond formation protein B [Parerythrobacter jejuensis]